MCSHPLKYIAQVGLQKLITTLLEAQTEIASVHGGFAIRRVSTSPLSQYPHAIIFAMITDQDILKLKKVFATKDDLNKFATKEALADLRIEVGEVHDKLDLMHDKIDRFLGVVDTLRVKEGAGAVILARHTRQIKSLAAHTGATLSD